MKFALAIAVFGLFAFFISWGIIELLKGRPWLLIAALGVFLGTFVKYGCRSHRIRSWKLEVLTSAMFQQRSFASS